MSARGYWGANLPRAVRVLSLTSRQDDFAEDLSDEGKQTQASGKVDKHMPPFRKMHTKLCNKHTNAGWVRPSRPGSGKQRGLREAPKKGNEPQNVSPRRT
jgi:hypothetical protein